MKFTGIKLGDRFQVEKRSKTSFDEERGGKKEYEEVRVIGIYPSHLMVQNRYGTRFCVTNGELYTLRAKGML